MSEFSSNMGSYSWVGSIIPLLEKKINCFKKLEHHTNTIVKKWVIEIYCRFQSNFVRSRILKATENYVDNYG